MADAHALFKRHWENLVEKTHWNCDQSDAALIYAACIIAEAIRNTMDEADGEVKGPKP